MAIVDAGANQTPALEILYRHISITMITCRQGKVFWEKVSKMQEKGDADVGEIENSGEEQECRKKTKKENKTMGKNTLRRTQIRVLTFEGIYFLIFALFTFTSLHQAEYKTIFLAVLSFFSMAFLVYLYKKARKAGEQTLNGQIILLGVLTVIVFIRAFQ